MNRATRDRQDTSNGRPALTAVGALTASLLALLVGCQSSGNSLAASNAAAAQVSQSLDAAFAMCTEQHGYDQVSGDALPANELGEGELAWRECAYDAVNRIARPAMRQPEALDELLDADRAMTAQIAEGAITRDERKAANATRIAEIRLQEQALREAEALSPREPYDFAADLEFLRLRDNIDRMTLVF